MNEDPRVLVAVQFLLSFLESNNHFYWDDETDLLALAQFMVAHGFEYKSPKPYELN